MNAQIDLKIKPDVDHDVDLGLEDLFGPFFYGLF